MKPTPLLKAALFIFALVAGAITQAQIPHLLHDQGTIANQGVNFENRGPFRFALVDSAAATTYWSNDGTSTGSHKLAIGYTDLPADSGKGPDHPVHSVNWYDMVKWCNARSELEGLSPCYSVAGAIYRKTHPSCWSSP